MILQQSFRKTRIAPTPSGLLHIGNVVSFSITAAIASMCNAKILLRIDDLDIARTNKVFVQDIFDTLNFLEIPWHEGPRNYSEYQKRYSQTKRLALYNKALNSLAKNEHLFACSCSRAEIAKINPDGTYPDTCCNAQYPLSLENHCWRLYTDARKDIFINSLQGAMQDVLPPTMSNFVVKKKDGYPSYQLASLVDDIYFGVDLIVRGADLYPSTLAQLFLSKKLNNNSFSNTAFVHHKLVNNIDGNKLSKSAGALSVKQLRARYKSPRELFCYISRAIGANIEATSWFELGKYCLSPEFK